MNTRVNPWVANRPERQVAPLNRDIVESHMRLRQLQRLNVIVARNDMPTLRSIQVQPRATFIYHVLRFFNECASPRQLVAMWVIGVILGAALDTLMKGSMCAPVLAGCPNR